MNGPRVAIVHERFTCLAGSERVVEQLHALWPDAVIHSPLVDTAALPPGLARADVRCSSLQRLYRGGSGYAHLLPFLPAAVARLDLSGADVVITSHHAFANRVRRHAATPVVSYTHSPARWMWEPAFLAGEPGGTMGRAMLSAFARTQRGPDRAAARAAEVIVANSRHVAKRIRSWWGRDAVVVPPPVDVDLFTPSLDVAREPFFLFAGRLVPYKRPLVAVEAAKRAGVRLVVAGDGRMRAAVEAAARPGIDVVGYVNDVSLRDLYRRCQALVFPGEEDFGIVPVEAQACGAPVLARAVGGVLDSVIDGRTGRLYDPRGPTDEVDALAAAMRSFDAGSFDADVLRRHAEGFSREAFRARFAAAAAPAFARFGRPAGVEVA